MKISGWLLVVVLSLTNCLACTIICLQDGQQVMLGKNLDWPVANGTLYYNPKGIMKVEMSGGDHSWQAKHASVTVGQFGRNLPIGGMNEAGLIIESTAYSISRYPDPLEGISLNEFEWIQYHLDRCATVEQVVESARIIAPVKWVIGLHYFIADPTGRCAFIEWLGGDVYIYTGADLPVAVQSNNSYGISLRYLSHFEGFGGDKTKSHGAASQERFVRAARFTREPINSLVPSYLVEGLERVKQHDTQWSAIYGTKYLEMSIRVGKDPAIHSISLRELEKQHPNRYAMHTFSPTQGEQKNLELIPYSIISDRKELEDVIIQLVAIGDLSQENQSQILEQWSKYQSKCEIKKPLFKWRFK